MKQIVLFLAAAAFTIGFGLSSAMAGAIGGAKEPIDWSGPYWGISGGIGRGQSEIHNSIGVSTGPFDRHGGLLGVTGGYNWLLGPVIVGAEADISLSTIKGTTSVVCGFCSTNLKWLGTLRGRIGYPLGKFMPYATGGLAVGRIKTELSPVFMADTKLGWTAGAGLAYAFTTGFSAKTESLYTDFGDSEKYAGLIKITAKNNNYQIFRVGLNFAF